MSNQNNLLSGETLITLAEAADDFGGVSVPYATVRNYVYRGIKGLKLESVCLNKKFTSKEAIQRFIERKQNLGLPQEKSRIKPMTQEQVEAGLRRHGIVEWKELFTVHVFNNLVACIIEKNPVQTEHNIATAILILTPHNPGTGNAVCFLDKRNVFKI